jgi:hypothetical protein
MLCSNLKASRNNHKYKAWMEVRGMLNILAYFDRKLFTVVKEFIEQDQGCVTKLFTAVF